MSENREYASVFLLTVIATCAVLLLAGCTYEPESLEQFSHRVAGRIIACDAARWTTPEVAIEHTMTFARAREDLQHPGQCGPGCILDLENWRRGAEVGAQCVEGK